MKRVWPVIALMTSAAVAAEADSGRLEVRVDRGEASLAGTLHLPRGEGPFPAVVLTHGSEPGRRAQRAYVRQAEALVRRGIAALAFDKRGVGDSTGTYVEAPDLEVPAGDVLAWVDFLAARREIRADRIGVLGWSQGGWVGPLAASKSERVAFVVSISGPGVSPLEQNIFDKTNRFRATGASEEQVRSFSRAIRLAWTYLVDGSSYDEARAAWDEIAHLPWFRDGYDGPPLMERERLLAHPRMTHYVAHSSYDPVPVLERLEVPLLAVFGDADTVVPVQASVEAMRGAFARSGNDAFTYKIFPGADHGIRVRADDGSRILAPGFSEYVVDWVASVVR